MWGCCSLLYVLLLVAAASAAGPLRAGHILVTDVNTNRISVYNTNDQSYDAFSLLNAVGEKKNYGYGRFDVALSTGFIYKGSQDPNCVSSALSGCQHKLLQISPQTGEIVTDLYKGKDLSYDAMPCTVRCWKGVLYIGTAGNGVVAHDLKTHKETTYSPRPAKTGAAQRVTDMQLTKAGKLVFMSGSWSGNQDSKLYACTGLAPAACGSVETIISNGGGSASATRFNFKLFTNTHSGPNCFMLREFGSRVDVIVAEGKYDGTYLNDKQGVHVNNYRFKDPNFQLYSGSSSKSFFNYNSLLKFKVAGNAADFYSTTLGPDGKVYVSDFSFNTPFVLTTAGAPAGTPHLLGNDRRYPAHGRIFFMPGPYAPNSVSTGYKSKLVAGVNATVQVSTVDFAGKAYSQPDADLRGSLEAEVMLFGKKTRIVLAAAVRSLGGSKYEVVYAAQIAASYKVSITLGNFGYHVKGSPWNVAITPTTTSSRESTVGMSHADLLLVAGTKRTVLIVAKDRFSNLRNAGGDTFKLLLRKRGGHDGKPLTHTAVVVDRKDGSYSATYSPQLAGEYEVAVELANGGGDVQFLAAPRSLIVQAALAEASRSVAESLVLKTGVIQGEQAHWTLKAMDAYGNYVTKDAELCAKAGGAGSCGGRQFSFAISGAAASAPATVAAQREADGYWHVKYMQSFAGSSSYDASKNSTSYQVAVSLGGAPVAGSPFTVVVRRNMGGIVYVNKAFKIELGMAPLAIRVSCAVLAAMALLWMVWISRNTLQPAVAFASPEMMYLILLGCIATYAAGFFWSFSYEPELPGAALVCIGRDWFVGLGFVLLWGSLFLKLKRTHTVVVCGAGQGANASSAGTSKLLGILLLLLLCEGAILLAFDLTEAPHFDNPAWSDVSDVVPADKVCYSSVEGTFYLALGGFKLLLVLWGTSLVWRTRDIGRDADIDQAASATVKSWLSESNQIGFALYNLIFTSVVVAVLMNNTEAPQAKLLLRSVELIWPTTVAMLCAIVPKYMSVALGARPDARAKSMVFAARSHMRGDNEPVRPKSTAQMHVRAGETSSRQGGGGYAAVQNPTYRMSMSEGEGSM